MARAHGILALEAQLGVAVEALFQRHVLAAGWAVPLLNNYYALMFLPPNLAFLAWAFLRRPDVYPLVRNAVVLTDGIGFAVHWALPVAPPRLLPDGAFVSTLSAAGHPMAYGSQGLGAVTSPYAALPSLHFAWALLVAGGIVLLGRSRWRWAAALHPVLMLLAIVGTGNHYLLDAAAGGVLVAASTLAVLGARRLARDAGACSRGPGSAQGAAGLVPRLVAALGVCGGPRRADGTTT